MSVKMWTQNEVVKRSESLAKEAIHLWNWSALERKLKVTKSKPKGLKKKTVKKALAKKAAKKATTKRPVKKAPGKRIVKKAAKTA